MPTKPVFDPGEEVIFDVAGYGSGRGHGILHAYGRNQTLFGIAK